MQRYLILAQSNATAAALAAWRERLAFAHDCWAHPSPLIVPITPNLEEAGATAYQFLVSRLEGLAAENPEKNAFERITVLVDAVDAAQMSIISQSANWHNLIAMLILTFPEVRWVFGVVLNPTVESLGQRQSFPTDAHSLASLAAPWRDPLFDPTALREWVKAKCNETLRTLASGGHRHEPLRLPKRGQLAAVIEDEMSFAVLHGYAAYRFGFRGELVTSWAQMKALFQDDSNNPPTPHPYVLLFEDMRLQFPDKPADLHLSDLVQRGQYCNRLADDQDHSQWRFMITTGQESGPSTGLVKRNERKLGAKKHGKGKLLTKPIGGPIDVWNVSELACDPGLRKPRGTEMGYIFPSLEDADDDYDGHGAPGKIALIATTLLDRARRLATESLPPAYHIRRAVFANEALEMLGGKAPAMSLEALAIKHMSEVSAECAFFGAGFHANLDDRISEIDQDTMTICKWYKSRPHFWSWDAKAAIYNEFVKFYRHAGQMEEQDRCLAEFRWCNRKMICWQAFTSRRPFDFAISVTLGYAELLLVNFARICLAFFAWIMFFACLSYWLTYRSYLIFFIALQLTWMVGGGTYEVSSLDDTPTSATLTLVWLSIASNIVGVFHLGILMSFLYSLISRK